MPQESNNATQNVAPVVENTTPATSNVANVNVDYDKMAEALEKRTNSFMKTYLKEQGLSENEMQEAIKTYKANKTQAQNQVQTNLTETQNQLEKSNLEKRDLKVEIEIMKQGIDSKKVPYLMKMGDFKDCFDDKGTILPEKVKEALDKVFTDVPELKTKEETKSGVQVGADTTNTTQPSGNLFNFGFTGVRNH